MTLPFPNPTEHAVVMVEACGTIEAARDTAQFNCDFAQTDFDSLYWFEVLQVLEREAVCLAN